MIFCVHFFSPSLPLAVDPKVSFLCSPLFYPLSGKTWILVSSLTVRLSLPSMHSPGEPSDELGHLLFDVFRLGLSALLPLRLDAVPHSTAFAQAVACGQQALLFPFVL